MKRIFIINGSASNQSSNQLLIQYFVSQSKGFFEAIVFNDLKTLPHFDPELFANNPPEAIVSFRHQIEQADGVMICTPEYVFSIPSGLKNAIEWCVASTVFSNKPMGIITASANGQKGHEELQLLMQTLMANFTPATTLLIQGIKGKMNNDGSIADSKTQDDLTIFIDAFKELIGGK